MKESLTALKNQIVNNVSYLTEGHGYIKSDSWDLIQKDKFPFFNIVNVGTKIIEVPRMSFKEAERHIIDFQIEYAVSSFDINELYEGDSNNVGIDEFTEDIWSAIKTDFTLNGVVDGQPVDDEGMEWEAAPGILKPNLAYIAGYTMRLKFYKDYFV